MGRNQQFVNEGLVNVRFIKSAKTATAGAYQLMHKLQNIFPVNIIIIISGLSCNFLSCKNDFYSGLQVYELPHNTQQL